jgi:tRNA A37 threonylcarbamoyladenosine dehydratase
VERPGAVHHNFELDLRNEEGIGMILHRFSRTELAIGPEGLEKMKQSSICVLGIGGVGSFAVEALARTGVGRLILVDRDNVDITNVNRQIHAFEDTVGKPKVELMQERVLRINPDCEVVPLKMFYTPETRDTLFAHDMDYVIDAVDTISSKIDLIVECKKRGIPIVSSMGAANKMDPSQFRVLDISRTTVDPIAKVIRRELRKRGIFEGVPVVCSSEHPLVPREDVRRTMVSPDVEAASTVRKAKNPPASIAFVPPVAGMILASVAVRDLLAGHVSDPF